MNKKNQIEDYRDLRSVTLEQNLKFVRDRITQLRVMENISERSLGVDIGKGVSYIQQVSSGRINPSLVTLFQICDRFSITPSEFFDPEFHNPSLLRKAQDILKKLSDEQLEAAIELLKFLIR